MDETVIGNSDRNIRKDCNEDQSAAIAYLQDSDLVILYNDEQLLSVNSKETKILQRSLLKKIRIQATQPSQTNVLIQTNELVDVDTDSAIT